MFAKGIIVNHIFFQGNRPGANWLRSFMKRWKFSVKQPSALEKTRKLAASDPRIIYGFYDILEQTLNKLNISDRPGCIWNVDESNLYIDPQREKVIGSMHIFLLVFKD